MSTDQNDLGFDAVEDAAADWIVRQDGDDLSDRERDELAIWLATPDHRAAYDRQRAVWQKYQAMGRVGMVSRPARWRLRQGFRPLVPAALAASVALAFTGYLEDWPNRLRADYATGVGERRTVVLADGSTVHLDSRTALTFDQAGGKRTVRLLEGAAAFAVAPDARHPFTVNADGGSVTALGTAFAVRESAGRSEVAVSEHSVKVRTPAGETAVVHEGEATHFGNDSIGRVSTIDVASETAWTRGKLIVFDQPLGEVVARIGRERRGYWTVRGPAASLRVNGVYDLNAPLAALAALKETFDLHAFELSDRFVILSQ